MRANQMRNLVSLLMAHLRAILVITAPTIGLLVIGGEVILRLAGYTPYYLDAHAFIPSQDSNLLYQLRPGFQGLYAGVSVSFNSMGLRGAEPRASQAAPVFRVLTVGDSVTFGQGVADDETLAAQLETRLARRHEGTLVEVLNLGVPGYDTCQEYWSYRDRAPQSRHDVVLLLYYENDTDPSVFRVENGVVISPDTKVGAFHEAMAWARKSVMSYNLVWTRWQVLKQRFASRARYRDDVAAKFTENNQGWQRSRACLKELLELAHQHAGRVLVIPFPVPGFLRERPYPHHDYVETVCKVVTSGGADCLDVVEILQRSETPLTVSVVENHPSAQVYEIVANQIVASLP